MKGDQKDQAVPQCPLCKKPPVEKYRPFCSARCADVDLGRWFGERYVMPTDQVLEDGEETSESSESKE